MIGPHKAVCDSSPASCILQNVSSCNVNSCIISGSWRPFDIKLPIAPPVAPVTIPVTPVHGFGELRGIIDRVSSMDQIPHRSATYPESPKTDPMVLPIITPARAPNTVQSIFGTPQDQ